MRGYTNSKGEFINVSDEHLYVASKIKNELQKMSPSMRCNWRTHKKMMLEEGFDNSDYNESYRCLIKNYQSKNGLINSKEKFVDLISEKKLTSIKNAVGELAYSKREIQLESQKLGKLKRDLTLWGVVAEEISEAVKEIKCEPFSDVGKIKVKGKNKILVPVTDWHIGLVTDNYNYSIAKKRVEKYVEHIIKYSKDFSVDEIYLAGLGDLCENVYMRTTQAYDVEFNFSEQIVKASELLINMIATLQKELKVNYLGVCMGNHDRMFIKGQTLENDSAMRVVDFCVTKFIELNNFKNVKVRKDNFDGISIATEINGFNIKMIHGDGESKSNIDKIRKHISLDETMYDMLIFGHFHHFGVMEENNGRVCVNFGCLQGTTDYSKKLGYNTLPSQGIVIITEGNLIPIRVGLS